MIKNGLMIGLFIASIATVGDVNAENSPTQELTEISSRKDQNDIKSDQNQIITDGISTIFQSLIGGGAVLVIGMFIGWVKWKDLKNYCSETIKDSLKKEIESGHIDLGFEKKFKDLHGRLDAGVALTMGRSSYNPETYEIIREDMYELAIRFSKRAYETLKDCGSPEQWYAANNLAFYYSLPTEPKAAHSSHAAKLVRLLRDNDNFFHDKPWVHMTYATAVSAYPSEFTDKEIGDAHAMIIEIINDSTMNEMWRKEAEFTLSKLKRLM